MSNGISMYPVLGEETEAKIFDPITYKFCYERDGHKYPLKAEQDLASPVHLLSDKDNVWVPEEYGFTVTCEFRFKSCNLLFNGNEAIACHDSSIGLAVMWTSPDSRQRGVIPVGKILNSSKDEELSVSHSFPAGLFRGEVKLTPVLYIKDSGNPVPDEKKFANTPGYIIGTLDSYIIKFDGNGSFFPIYEISSPGNPLWDLYCSWDDPTTDKLEDCISLNFNTAHKSYKFIDKEDKSFNPQLFIEIMCQALSGIIETLRNEDKDFSSLLDYSEGSVAQSIAYFRDTLGWDLSTPLTVSQSIRKYLESKLASI